jgi:hypothetical protein
MTRYLTLAFVLALGCGSKPTEKKVTPPLQPAKTAPVASAPIKTPESTPATVAAVVTPTFIKDKVTLYDPREAITMPSVSKEESEKILSKLFTKRLAKIEDCKDAEPGAKESEEDIKSGQIAPLVVTKLTGAFTAPGLSQSLYLVDVGECNADSTRDAAATTSWWVLTEKDEIKAKPVGAKANFYIPVDLEQNGTLEILTVVEGSSGGGSQYEYADLYMLSEKETTKIESFTLNDVMTDYCSVPNEEGEPGMQEIMVVSMTPTEPGKLPTFSGEKFTGTCEKTPKWKPIP